MRIDGVVWQKSKIQSISGFLSDEGGALIFTKYRDGYTDHGKVLYTKQELKTNRMIDGLIGKMKPEKELFRVNKSGLSNLNIMKMEPVTINGTTYYSVYATFKADGVDYAITHSCNSAEETGQLDEIFA